MALNDILKPRKDVLSNEGIEGIVDLENLKDTKGKRLEAKPKDFLDLTYPTSDIKLVVDSLHRRFNDKGRSSGLFLFEGYKGSGKSHILLLIYHLAKNPVLAKEWLRKHGLQCDIPDDIIPIVQKFTDFPLNALWDLIIDQEASGKTQSERPNLNQLRAAIKGKHIFLILDELEMGIRSISNKAIQDQNLSFLQMLTEESGRSEDCNITIFASIYDGSNEPGATLKRISPRTDIKFSNSTDRTKIVLHRIFENRETVENKKIENLLVSYRNDWIKKGLTVSEEYIDKYKSSYPFSPELIQLVQEQARNNFQGTRGALGLLGAIVKHNYRKFDLITAASASISERSIKNRIIDLDPGMVLTSCAENDLKDLKDKKFSEEIVSCVLLSTLAASGRAKGMTEDVIGVQVMKPGDDINEYRAAIKAFHKYGTYFHEQEGVYYFDQEEKPNAKVEYRSLGIDPGKALSKAFEFWTGELFCERDAVVFNNIEQVQAELKTKDSKKPRYVLAPKRLSPADRHAVYFGQSNRNLIIILEPKNKDFDVFKNPDIIKWAQRHIASVDLQNSTNSVERKRQFEKIAKDDKSYIIDSFRKAGLSFIWVQKYGSTPEEDQIEVEQLGNSYSREEVINKLSQQFFPNQLFEEHMLEHLQEFTGKSIRDIERAYRETIGFPIPTHHTRIREAVCSLCGQSEIGIRHEKDSACGRKPNLSENEWPDAILTEPFEDAKTLPGFSFTGKKEAHETETGGIKEEGYEESASEDKDELAETAEIIGLETPFVKGLNALRQEAAMKLAENEDSEVHELVVRIYFEKKNVDFSSLPAGIRGAMSGLGGITADLTISRKGIFSKGDTEQFIESLPQFPEAEYKAEMKASIKNQEKDGSI